MAERGNGHAAHEGASSPVPPAVVVTFAAEGIGATIHTQGELTVAHLMLAAYHLDCVAREARAGQLAKEAYGGLVTDPAAFLAQMRAAGNV